jgi:hypothetical protein
MLRATGNLSPIAYFPFFPIRKSHIANARFALTSKMLILRSRHSDHPLGRFGHKISSPNANARFVPPSLVISNASV